MIETKRKLSDQDYVLLPAAHGSGGFVHMRSVPADAGAVSAAATAAKVKATSKAAKRPAPKLAWPFFFSSRQFGAQMPRTPQMQSGATPAGDCQMGASQAGTSQMGD